MIRNNFVTETVLLNTLYVRFAFSGTLAPISRSIMQTIAVNGLMHRCTMPLANS